jgi:hypothetical protein
VEHDLCGVVVVVVLAVGEAVLAFTRYTPAVPDTNLLGRCSCCEGFGVPLDTFAFEAFPPFLCILEGLYFVEHGLCGVVVVIVVCQSGFTTLSPELLQEQPAVVLSWGMSLASWLLAIDEYSGHECLRDKGHRSIIPFVHGRTELYCSSMYEPESFLFLTPWKWHLPKPFI